MRKQTLKQLEKQQNQKGLKEILRTVSTIEEKQAHPRRPRSKYQGEMIQMDASSFEWCQNTSWHLHLAVDDATSEVVGAYLDTQETLNGYYQVFAQILKDYGIPAMFYTDKRTVFEYKRKNNAFDNEDTYTQFAYACKNLGVAIKTTSVAQAKGRVERMNQTFQSRLPVELRRARIENIDEANAFLKSYLKKFNQRFALPSNDIKSVYEKQIDQQKINDTLAVISSRKIDKGNAIKYKKNYYFPINAKQERQLFLPATEALVIETFDARLLVNIKEELYVLEEIEAHERLSKVFDFHRIKDKEEKEIYVPKMSHPYKEKSFKNFQKKQKHRQKSCAYT